MDYRRRRLSEHVWDNLWLCLVAAATVLIQTQLLPSIFAARINLLLVAVVVWALLRADSRAALMAFYGGLTLDLLGSLTLGVHAFALLLVVGLAYPAAERLPAENWLLVLLLVGLGTMCYQALMLLATSDLQTWQSWATFVLAPALIVNLVVALPQFLVLRWWSERLPPLR